MLITYFTLEPYVLYNHKNAEYKFQNSDLPALLNSHEPKNWEVPTDQENKDLLTPA